MLEDLLELEERLKQGSDEDDEEVQEEEKEDNTEEEQEEVQEQEKELEQSWLADWEEQQYGRSVWDSANMQDELG